jgi:hypothetical protein
MVTVLLVLFFILFVLVLGSNVLTLVRLINISSMYYFL